jgi:hypothetical protein
MTDIKRETVLDLARAEGFGELGDEVAGSIAAGASAAIAAVRRALNGPLFDAEPAQFLPLLEALARDEDQT